MRRSDLYAFGRESPQEEYLRGYLSEELVEPAALFAVPFERYAEQRNYPQAMLDLAAVGREAVLLVGPMVLAARPVGPWAPERCYQPARRGWMAGEPEAALLLAAPQCG